MNKFNKSYLCTIICILFFLINRVTVSYAQTWLWAKSESGPGGGEGYSVATDTFGNVFLTGENRGFFLTKYDASGNVLWAKSELGNMGGVGYSAATDAFGNVYVTGYFGFASTITFGTITLSNIGLIDIFLVKYDASGNVLWAKSVGGGNVDEGLGVATDTFGNVFLTGFFYSPTITFGITTLINTSANGFDVFLTKYDASGNVLWAKSAGGTSYDEGLGVATDAFGNVYVTGDFDSPAITFETITLINTNAGNNDVFLAKYDSFGNILWAKSAGGTSYDKCYNVATDVSGNVYVTGYFSSSAITFGTTTLTNAGSANVFLAKYDASGKVLWAKGSVGLNGNVGYSVATDASGNVYITGKFSEAGVSSITFGSITLPFPAGSTPIPGATDPMFIVQYDSTGNVRCASALASGGDDKSGVATDAFGNAYIGGDFMINPFIVGTDTLPLTGGIEDVFIAKYTCCNNVPANNSITGPQTICYGATPATLAGNLPGGGNGSVNYIWQTSTDNSHWISLPGSTSQSYSPDPLTASSYYRRVVANFCDTVPSAPVLITVYTELTNNTVSASQSVCPGNTPHKLMGSLPTGSTGNYMYQWQISTTNDTTGFTDIPGAQNIDYSPPVVNTETWYRRRTSSGSCTYSSAGAVDISMKPPSLISLGNDTSICKGYVINLKTEAGLTNYVWQDGSSSSIYKVTHSGTYQVKAKDINNCNVVGTINIVDCSIEIPDIFTPNGDGKNESFIIRGLPKNSEITIYNRWGNIVYHNSNYDGSWNGTNKWSGNPESEGVYYYIAVPPEGQPFTGYVVIIR